MQVRRDQRRRFFETTITVAFFYALFGVIGAQVPKSYVNITSIWPSAGLALGFALSRAHGVYSGVFIGSLLANFYALRFEGPAHPLQLNLLVAFLIALGATLQVCVGTRLLVSRARPEQLFKSPQGVLVFLLFAAILSTLINSSWSVSITTMTGYYPPGNFAQEWLIWWLGDATGILVFTPLTSTLAKIPARHWLRQLRRDLPSLFESILWSLSFALMNYFIFGPGYAWGGRTPLPTSYLTWPLLLWAALRFGDLAFRFSLVLFYALVVVGTSFGFGPFATFTLELSLILLASFIFITSIGALLLRATIVSRKEAEDAVHLRDEFLSIASHELQTPLTPLKLKIQLLQRSLTSDRVPPIDEVKSQLKSALQQVDRLTRLVNDLLDVSRISRGIITLERENFDLVELVNEVTQRFSEHAKREGYTITVRSLGALQGHWDQVRIDQTITNLLSNAIKYGKNHPIDIEVMREGNVSSGPRAIVRIIDRGIGIPLEAQQKIFERYERAVPVTHFGGMGLGLYISRQIARAHGGDITVKSEPEKGSIFTMTLPIVSPTK